MMVSNAATDQARGERIIVEIALPVPADVVWRALREPERIAHWFGWDAETLSGEIKMIFFDAVEADDAHRVLRFNGMPDRFEVEARGGAAKLRLVRAPTASDNPPEPEDGYDEMVEGWIAFVQQLRHSLTLHPDEKRRTIRLSGVPKGAGISLATFGLGSIPATGKAWSASVGPDAALHGEVWHRERHQTGLTVSAWGDGLLVITCRPVSDGWPTGQASATLVTFALDDKAFAALEARWKQWWSEHFSAEAIACQ